MGFHFPLIFPFLSLLMVALQASHDTLPAPQLYWNSILPNTQMPKSISELLRPDVYAVVGKGKSTDHKGRPVNTGVETQKLRLPFLYRAYAHVAESQLLHQDPNIAVFFFEKDMLPGTIMNLHFPANTKTATFLPRNIAESIPFSSSQLPEILLKLSAKPNSADANAIEQAIKECETPGIKGEEKRCATSLESMIDFSTSKLGTRNVQAISTEVVEKGTKISMHKYTTMPGVKNLAGDEAVVCHKQNYPYALFYCHTTKPTKAYVVTLKGDDGVKSKAVAICHLDTSEWNPKHLAFQMLKVKPGTVPVCHFLPNDHVVWVPNH